MKLLITDSFELLRHAPRPSIAVIRQIDKERAYRIMEKRPCPQAFYNEARGRAICRQFGMRYKVQPLMGTPERTEPMIRGDGILIVRCPATGEDAASQDVEFVFVNVAIQAAENRSDE